jgi:hypothetical protein
MYTNAEIDSSRFQCCGINFVLRDVHFNILRRSHFFLGEGLSHFLSWRRRGGGGGGGESGGGVSHACCSCHRG